MTKLFTPKEVADSTRLSYAYVLAACKRAAAFHPLPHIKVGESNRPHYLIDMADVDRWLEEEKHFQASMC